MSDSRRVPSAAKKKPPAGRGFSRGPRATAHTVDEVDLTELGRVLAAHASPVTPADCVHPPARRDLKNPARCCACGAVGLDPPAARRR